jgi:hypothetical protein
MMKASVLGTGVNQLGQAKLFYVTKPLKEWVLNDFKNQFTADGDKAVNGVVDYFLFIHRLVSAYKFPDSSSIN